MHTPMHTHKWYSNKGICVLKNLPTCNTGIQGSERTAGCKPVGCMAADYGLHSHGFRFCDGALWTLTQKWRTALDLSIGSKVQENLPSSCAVHWTGKDVEGQVI